MFFEILKYGFLVIFFSTAVIGIASIPDWIKIPEWYRKKIFIVLILEVIGVILIYSKQEFTSGNATGIPEITLANNDWIALNENGAVIKPEIIIETEDTTILKQLGKQTLTELRGLTGEMDEAGLGIINGDEVRLGYIKDADLERNGLFNSFKTAKGEITSTENYAYVKWSKAPDGSWKKKGSFIGPLELEIADYAEGIYYLLRIAWADLEKEVKYVHVINVRMEPTLQ